MKITSCQAVATCPGRNFVIVRIETSTGLVGWGDATLNGRELAVVSVINEHLAPLLIDEDPLRIEHLWQSLYIGAYWRGGPVQNTALAGIDMALWDILGKEAGQPVYQLLGGRCRDRAMAYASVAARSPAGVVEQVHKRMSEGWIALRIQSAGLQGASYGESARSGTNTARAASPAQPPTSPLQSSSNPGTGPSLAPPSLPGVGFWEPAPYLRALPELFSEVRAAVGDGVELLHDVHHRLTPTQAAQLAKELEPYHPFFLEDPIPPEHVHGLAQIRQIAAIPIALGEGLFDIAQCLPLITNRWIDYLRCDLGHIGGITPARKLAALCEPYAIKSAWHGPPDLSPIGHAANVHVDIAIPNFGIQEWTDFSVFAQAGKIAEIFQGGAVCKQGHVDVSDAPGLGIEINLDAARRYPYQRGYLPVIRRADGSVHPW